MSLSRRTILKGAGALPLLAGHFGFSALAQTASAPPGPRASRRSCSCMAMATMRRCGSRRCGGWRSNGVPRDRMLAHQFHRSAGAHRRHGRAAEPFLDRSTSAANLPTPSRN